MKKVHASRRRQAGLTLLELIVVLVVAGLLVSQAVPAMHGLLETMELRTASQSFHAHLHWARSEAIKRKARVVLCKSADGLNCTRSGGWEQGWIMFHDANNNATVDAGERILQREPVRGGRLRMRGNNLVDDYISYTPLGHTSLTSGAFQAGTLTVCHASASKAKARQIVIASGGRPRVQQATLTQCA